MHIGGSVEEWSILPCCMMRTANQRCARMRMASTEPNQRAPGQEKQCDGFASRRSDPHATPGDTNMTRDVLRLWLRLCQGWVERAVSPRTF